MIADEKTKEAYSRLAGNRECGDCTLCCKLLKIEIPEIQKKEGEWCKHCNPSSGCKIYDDRPSLCRFYLCGWRAFSWLGDHWKPNKCGLLINFDEDSLGNGQIHIHYNGRNENKWREEPFFSDIGQMATEFAHRQILVFVKQPRDSHYIVDGRWSIHFMKPLLVKEGEKTLILGVLPAAKTDLSLFDSEEEYYRIANGWISSFKEAVAQSKKDKPNLGQLETGFLMAQLALKALDETGFTYNMQTRQITKKQK
jgi:hypothetical protein